MNSQYEYILKHMPQEVHYDESFKGLMMLPYQNHEPIPMKFILTKENPYNYTFLVFHRAERDLFDIEEDMEVVTKIFKARCVVFDYPGYGLNKNGKDTPINEMIDCIVDYLATKGFRQDRIILFGYEHGCGPAVEYCKLLSARKKEDHSTETSGILLYNPTDTIPLGIDFSFEEFYNSVQNVVYYHVLMMIPKGDKSFSSFKELELNKAHDPEWKKRVEIVQHKYGHMTPASLDRTKVIYIVEHTTPWFKKINAQIMKYRRGKLNISMAISTVMKSNKKLPALPQHNMFLIHQFLKMNNLDDLYPIFEEKHIYSIVHVVMHNLEKNELQYEDPEMISALTRTTRKFRPFVTKHWKNLIYDYLSETFTRIDHETNFLDKKSKTQQSRKKVEIEDRPYGNHQMDASSIDGDASVTGSIAHSIANSEMTHSTMNSNRLLMSKKKTIGGASTYNYVVPDWAKGVEVDYSVFVKQPVNFSDYFVNKEGIAKRHRGNDEE